jgi:hypothetical protein
MKKFGIENVCRIRVKKYFSQKRKRKMYLVGSSASPADRALRPTSGAPHRRRSVTPGRPRKLHAAAPSPVHALRPTPELRAGALRHHAVARQFLAPARRRTPGS